MSLQYHKIPVLPNRPCVHPIASDLIRSYSVGRQNCSRAYQNKALILTLTIDDSVPEQMQACLATTMNATRANGWTQIPFTRTDARTLICQITPTQPGFFTFRAEFSADGGQTWVPDTVPDAWILVDPPQVDSLRLYSLIPTVSGTVADWKSDLKRIQGMGFNAVHLLPLTPLDTSESPYAAHDLFDIDHSYLIPGSPLESLAQLEDFIEAARTLDLRLCFDLVLNHVGVHSTIASRAPDWIVPDQSQSDGLKRARYWSNQGWLTWGDLALINYEHPSEAARAEIWEYMTAYALFWANYANATGGFVRFDNLHSSDPSFIQALTTMLHTEYPELGILAEYFTDDRTLLSTVPEWGLNLVLATPWNDKFVPELRDYLTYLHRNSEHIRYFMPITSHDSGAPAQEFGTSDSTIPRYVAAALLGTGATGIPQGVEWGWLERINFLGRQPKMPYPGEPRFASFLERVNAILAAHPAFRCGDNFRLVDEGHPAVIAAFRQDPETCSTGFLVICNFDTDSSQHFAADLSDILGTEGPFPCRDLLNGEDQVFPQAHLEILLPPCTAQVLMLKK